MRIVVMETGNERERDRIYYGTNVMIIPSYVSGRRRNRSRVVGGCSSSSIIAVHHHLSLTSPLDPLCLFRMMPTTITTTAFPLWFADDDDYDNDLGRQVTSSMLEDPFVPRVAYRKPITEWEYDSSIPSILEEFNMQRIPSSQRRHQLHAIDIDGVGKRPLCSSSNRIPHKEEEDYRRFRPDGLKQLIPSCVEDSILLHHQDAFYRLHGDILNHHDILIDWASLVAAPIVSSSSTTTGHYTPSGGSSSQGLPILPTPPATPSSDQASSAEVNDDDERTEEEEITDGDWTLLEDVTPLHLGEASSPIAAVDPYHIVDDDFVLL